MADRNNKSYQMYVLNLDNSRIFWLSLVFLLIFGLCFAIGLFFGRQFISGKSISSGQSSGSSSVDAKDVRFDTFMLNRMTQETQNQNFEFYQVLPKDKLTSEDIAHSIPNNNPPKSQAVETDDQDKSVGVAKENDSSDVLSTTEKKTKKSVIRDSAVKKQKVKIVSSYDDSVLTSSKPYSVQVASYLHQNVADSVKARLASRKMNAYVIKAKVNGKLYFRVRVGPFSAKEKASEALHTVRDGMGYSASYICTR